MVLIKGLEDIMIKIFSLIISFCVVSIFAKAEIDDNTFADLLRGKPGFAAEIPESICKSTFPFHKIIPTDLANTNGSQFNLFSFTSKKFDPEQPSILFIDGGPGGVWGPTNVIEFADRFPNANLVFFHFRGSGCSSFPSLSAELDHLITSLETVKDLEAIRNSYQIDSWKAVIGFSYGTDLARFYAHQFPKRIAKLVLEGLSKIDSVPDEQASQRLVEIVVGRFGNSPNLKASSTVENFQLFLVQLRKYLSQVPLNKNIELAALGPDYKNYFKIEDESMSRYFNRNTFLSIILLSFSGESSSSDAAIWMLLNNFGFINSTSDQIASVAESLAQMDKFLFPFLNPTYLTYFADHSLLSWRVLLAIGKSDKIMTKDSLCSEVDTLVLNGTQDGATPVENVQSFLSDKKCAGGFNTALLIHGGGHSNLLAMKCLTQYTNHWLNTENTSLDLKSCENSVTEQKY